MTPRLWFRRYVMFLAIFAMSVLSPALGFASDLVFGPVTCQRGTGAPTVFNYSFTAAEPSRGFVFKVYNGGLEDTIYEQVSSSIITLNGVQILGPNNFNQIISYLEVPIALQAQNSLSVEVRGRAGGAIIVKIFPTVVIKAPAQNQIFSTQPVIVSGSLYSASTSISVNGFPATPGAGIFSVTGLPLLPGNNVLTATATVAGGFSGSDSVQVTLDSTPPVVSIQQPEEGFVTRQEVAPLYTVKDALDPDPRVTVSPLPPYIAEGAYHLSVTATDWAGNTATATRGFVIDKTAPTVAFGLPSEGSSANHELVPEYTIVDSLDPHPTVNLEPPPPYATERHYQVTLTGTDWAGNQAFSTRNFTIDLTTPVISGLTPTPGSSTADAQVVVSANISDALSGIQAASARLEIDDTDVTASTAISEMGVSYRPATALTDGPHHAVLSVRDRAGNDATANWIFSVDRTPPAISIDTPVEEETVSTPTVVLAGSVDDATATITVNGTSVAVIGGNFTLSGIALSPGQNEFTVIATDALGNNSLTVRHITYRPQVPVVNLTATPSQVQVGGSVVLQWTTNSATTVSITPSVGEVALNGTASVTPTATATYTLSASGPGGTATVQTTVVVVPASGNVSILASSNTIHLGETVTLTWTANDVTGVLINQGIGVVQSAGSRVVQPTSTTEYVITAAGPEGASQASVLVMVLGSVQPLPEGSFGAKYQDLIPQDATVTAYDAKRFSLVTGVVNDRNDQPVAGVRVSIHSHSEYGTAITNGGGRFTLPVEGGGVHAILYSKAGFIQSHRQVDVLWNDVAIVETVTMISEDVAVTRIAFNGDANTILVHQSTPVVDERGRRSATIVFTGDNDVYAKVGTKEIQLYSIDVRATEFETPTSMPAELPPTSAYTYCAELAVDGAEEVRFARPVTVYVDNFLGFGVGEIVPVGYFDRNIGVWNSSENGVVVRLLDTNGDGVVDALDTYGDGKAHETNVVGLTDPMRFIPGSTYWRVKVQHFTPFDLNWSFRPPVDFINPNPEGAPSIDQQQSCDWSDKNGSYCERKSRIVHEDIPIAGTGMTFHYASNRVLGYKTIVTVPASGSTVPASLTKIVVRMEVAGRVFESILPPSPNRQVEFVWDGLDYLGRKVEGTIIGKISIGFSYWDTYYAASGPVAWAVPGSRSLFVRSRQEVVSWKNSTVTLHLGSGGDIADGWTIPEHHFLSASDTNKLYKGDGTTIDNNALVITTVVGSGVSGYSGDGGQGTAAELKGPSGVTVDNVGNIFVVDSKDNRVRKISTDGIIATVAGNGSLGYSGDGGIATLATLNMPVGGVAVDMGGNVYIADSFNNRIRKINANGIISTVAGSGAAGFSGDGGPATQAMLNKPYRITLDRYGNLYITEWWNNRVRKVDSSGIITTVAGNGNVGYSGDNGLATQAALNYPGGIAVDGDGNIYIVDSWNYRIRKVDNSGIITTVAGNGSRGYSGDGGLATQAQLANPFDLTVDRTGNLYVADNVNNRIRKVDTKGIISTVVGNGNRGYSGDGKPPTTASLNDPKGVTIDSAGNIYVADAENCRVRKISVPDVFGVGTTTGDIPFADENGLGYIMSRNGLHIYTLDLASGKKLLTYGYNSADKLTLITDRFENQTTIQRDSAGIPTSVTSPDGIVTMLEINSENHLTRVLYPDGTHFTFNYSPDGFLTEEYDQKGSLFVHEYSPEGRIAKVFDPEGGTWNYSRATDSTGNIFSNVVTGEGNLVSYQDKKVPSGTYSSMLKESTGEISTITRSADGLSETTTSSCGMRGSKQYSLDSKYLFKKVSSTTATTPAGRKLISTFSRTYQDTNSDNVPDLITDLASTNDKTWTTTHNTLSSVNASTSPNGRIISSEYDPITLLTRQTNVPGLLSTTFEYDTRGRLSSLTTGSRTTTIAYDANSYTDFILTPENEKVDYSYDMMGNLRSLERPNGARIHYDYDQNGSMTAVTNPAKITNTFGYSANKQRNLWTSPLSGSYQYSYDKERKLETVSFPSGKVISNTYEHGLLATTSTPEGVTTYSYSCGSNLGSAVRGSETVSFTYDGSLVTSDTRPGTLGKTIGYAYNNDYAISTLTYAGGTIAFGFDNDGLLTSVGGLSITRNLQNGLPESVSGLGLTEARTFNGYGELDGTASHVSGATAYAWSVLMRDKSGRILQMQEMIGGNSIAWEYFYNPVGRLTDVKKDGVLVESYTYDLNGNRLTETNAALGISGRVYGYSTEDHVLTAGPDTYQFDVDGFLQSKTSAGGTANFAYSSRGELQTVWLPSGTILTYLYDPLGRRIAKKVNGTIVEKYLWKDQTTLLALYDGNDNLLQRYSYADARMPVSMTTGGSTYFLLTDQVGTLRAVADSAGMIVKRIDYDSFGNIIADTNPAFSIPFGFAGGLHDRDTELVRFGFRDYSPELGRWTAKDPIDFDGGDTNLYGYVMSDPVNYIDPSGLYDKDVHLGLTLQLAIKAGFSADVANQIAAADQGIDDNSDTGPFDKDGGPEYHFSSHTIALSKLNGVCSPEGLGQALHRLQDSYSHAGYSWETGGHIRDGVRPDRYDPAFARDSAMRSDTLRKLITIRKLQGSMW